MNKFIITYCREMWHFIQISPFTSKVIGYLIFTFASSELDLDVSSFRRLFEELTLLKSVLELCEQLSLLVILEVEVTSS